MATEFHSLLPTLSHYPAFSSVTGYLISNRELSLRNFFQSLRLTSRWSRPGMRRKRSPLAAQLEAVRMLYVLLGS